MYFLGTEDGKIKTEEFKLIEAEEETIRKWYEHIFYDEDMDEERKAEVLVETSYEEALDKYYPQKFEIDGKTYRIKWNTYDGDVVEKLK